MVIPSEYIQIVSAGIYSIALFYTIVSFQRTKRLDQITLLNKIFSDLRDLDHEIANVPLGSQYDNVRSKWYSRVFNSINWLSLLVNEKVINDKKMVPHINLVIINYYEDIFLKNTSVEERDSNYYPEFIKLYRSIKKNNKN